MSTTKNPLPFNPTSNTVFKSIKLMHKDDSNVQSFNKFITNNKMKHITSLYKSFEPKSDFVRNLFITYNTYESPQESNKQKFFVVLEFLATNKDQLSSEDNQDALYWPVFYGTFDNWAKFDLEKYSNKNSQLKKFLSNVFPNISIQDLNTTLTWIFNLNQDLEYQIKYKYDENFVEESEDDYWINE